MRNQSRFAFFLVLLLWPALACRPVFAIGWSEILVLAIIIIVLLGPLLWRVYRFWGAYQDHKRAPKESPHRRSESENSNRHP